MFPLLLNLAKILWILTLPKSSVGFCQLLLHLYICWCSCLKFPIVIRTPLIICPAHEINQITETNVFLSLQRQLSDESKIKVALGCTQAVVYIHSKHIVHQDIKGENIMVSFLPLSLFLLFISLCVSFLV